MAADEETEGRLRADGEAIFRAALERADPRRLIREQLHLAGTRLRVGLGEKPFEIDLSRYRRLLVLGAGKASAAMARGIEDVLGERIDGGLVVVKYGHTAPLSRIELMEAGHPVPDENSRRGAERLAELAAGADAETLVVTLISGGGSALLAAPLAVPGFPLSLAEKQETTRLLLACGAGIGEINCLRKHLSALKGGRLLRLLHPARSLSLILSDVVGDRLDVIASGLTVADASSYRDALAIVDKYDLAERLPAKVMALLKAGAQGRVEETLKPGDPALAGAANVLLGSNRESLLAAADAARRLGYRSVILTARASGEARELGRLLAGIARDIRSHGLLAAPPACVLLGGGATLALRRSGQGGCTPECAPALLAAPAVDPSAYSGMIFLSAATDGNDGPTDAAGAFASPGVLARARSAGLDPGAALLANDSYTFFAATGDLFKTGPTNTNVCDLQILLVAPCGFRSRAPDCEPRPGC